MDRFDTDRLIIRRFDHEDWPDVQKLAVDKEASEAAAWDHRWPTDEEGCKGATDFLAGHEYWAVCLKDGDRLIGFVSFNSIDDDKRLDLGHLFHREFNSQDYDTEALRCMIDHAFTHLGVRAVYADNAEEWTAQLAPLKKLGMTVLEPPPEVRGEKSSFRKHPDGTPIEFVGCRMQITREEWQRSSP
jgi:RimJ/RimL family protein N-acetyltransferase